MRLCRFDGDRLGVVTGDVVRDVTAALDVLPALRWPLPLEDPLIARLDAVIDRIATLLDAAPVVRLVDVALGSPVTSPSKIIGAPVNYRAHRDEIDDELRHGHAIKPISEWGLFLKASTALCGPSDGVAQCFLDERTDHEVELAVVIGRKGRDIPVDRALDHVAGYAIGLDITLRGPQFQSFRKSIDSYAVLGPWLVTADEIADPSSLSLSLDVDGVRRQQSDTSKLIYDVPRLIAYASEYYTLNPGDIIMTGTPDGVGPIRPGNILRAEIEGIGAMSVAVRRAA
ncbi:fumarylacetoacetate hydrolase family protein [Sphingomonas sp. YL-JM2C]